jgi:hypothetical protein
MSESPEKPTTENTERSGVHGETSAEACSNYSGAGAEYREPPAGNHF